MADSEVRTFVVDAPADRRAGSWLRAARVGHWGHFLVLPLAGLGASAPWSERALASARGVGIAFAVLAFGYLLNGIADRHMDATAEKNPLVRVEPSESHYRALAALVVVALALAGTGPLPVLLATLVCLASGLVYSIGPRLKRLPVVGTLLNATNFAPLLWVGLPTGHAPALGSLTAAFTLLLLQNQVLHEAADQEEDRRGGVRTTFAWLGPRAAASTVAALGVALAVSAAGEPTMRWLAAPSGVVFAIGVPWALVSRGHDAGAMGRARLAHRVLSIVAGAGCFVSSWV